MIENFKGLQNTNGLDKNKQNINRTGLNRSILSEIRKKIQEEDYLIIKGAEVLVDGEPTGEFVEVRAKLLSAEAFALHYLRRAKGSDRVLIDLMNRLYGSPKQTIDQNTKIDVSNFTEEQIDYWYQKIKNDVEKKDS